MNRKFYLNLCALTAMAAFPLLAAAQDIPLVGIDESGKAMEVLVPEAEVAHTLTTALQGMHASTVKALEERQAKQASEESPTPWTLRSVVIGVGANIELGLGPVTVGALPRFRMGFSNQPEPSIP